MIIASESTPGSRTKQRIRTGGVEVMTIGQYLQPTRMHLEVEEFIHPDQFIRHKEIGEAKGIEHVESGPLVCSSYHAECHV